MKNKLIVLVLMCLFSISSFAEKFKLDTHFTKGILTEKPLKLNLSKEFKSKEKKIKELLDYLKDSSEKLTMIGYFKKDICSPPYFKDKSKDEFLIDEEIASELNREVSFNIDLDVLEEITPKIILLKERNGDYVAFGLWTKNLTTWNLLRMNFNSISGDNINSRIQVGKDRANVDVDYLLRINNSNELKFSIYQNLDHEIFSPEKFTSGGRITYRKKFNHMNFDFFVFG